MPKTIRITGSTGVLEWTPPPAMQKVLEMLSPTEYAGVEGWLQHLIEGYLLVVMSTALNPSAGKWLDDQTASMVVQSMLFAVSESAEGAVPPGIPMH